MTHIEKYYVHHHPEGEDDYAGDSTTIAECGVSAILHSDGTTTPPGHDFYLKEAAYKADCILCLQALVKRLLGS